MGEWFSYKIRFANKEENFAEALINKGFATYSSSVLNHKCIEIDLLKINPELFQKGYLDNGIDKIKVGINDNYIYFSNKWSPDDRLCDAISKHFPNDVLDFSREYSGGKRGDSNWYQKNGIDTLKNGTPITGALYNISESLITQRRNEFIISLPIGDNNNKWGKIILPNDNIKYSEYSSINGKRKYNISVFFSVEDIPVFFKSGMKKINVKELIEKYYNSLNDYSNDMHSLIKIENLPKENFEKRFNRDIESEYYIVKIPCPEEISRSKFLTILLSKYDVDNKGTITLGEKRISKQIQIFDDYGNRIKQHMSVPDIKKYYEESQILQQKTINDIEEPELD